MKRATRKRCARCGAVAVTRDRRCKVQPFGRGSYWCGGRLVAAPLRTGKPAPKPAAAVVTLAKLRQAIAQLAKARTREKRARTSIRLWTKRVRYYQKKQDVIDNEAAKRAAAALAESAKPSRAYFDEGKPL